MENSLAVSENFLSIQGEGPTAGRPAVFLRLAGCNLTCGLSRKQQNSRLLEATWQCDTIEVWQNGEKYQIDQLLELFLSGRSGYLEALQQKAHLVVTGGEPLLQQKALLSFLKDLRSQVNCFVEIETNCTIRPDEQLSRLVSQWNVSPKLSNSGIEYGQRFFSDVIGCFAENPQAIFKFVVTRTQDAEEVISEFASPFQIAKDRIWLMPGSSTPPELAEYAPIAASSSIKFGLNYSHRLQLAIWGQTTGR